MPDTHSTGTTGSRRAFFRLKYPVSCHAVLHITGIKYPVVEISEGGLRLACIASGEFIAQNPVQGSLTLTSGVKCRVAGEVLRLEDDGKLAILRLTRGPSHHEVLAEQRHVAKIFPDWKPIG